MRIIRAMVVCAALAAFAFGCGKRAPDLTRPKRVSSTSPKPAAPRVLASSAVVSDESSASAASRFRGSDGSGTSTETDLPTEWSSKKNVAWKTALPGPGASSPIVHKDRIYVTCYSGYGIPGGERGDQKNLKRHLICLRRDNGKILWDKAVPSTSGVAGYRGFIALHGYASHTPACDDDGVYVFFGSGGVLAFDHDGKQLWRESVGKRTHGFGTAASVVLHKDLVIVNARVECNQLIALNKKTGKEVWKASEVPDSWSTPILVDAGNDKKELVVDSQDKLRGIDPDTGKVLWHCEGSKPPRYVCPSPVVGDGVIYATHGYHGPTSAVRPGGRGDVTESHRLWSVRRTGSNVPSPVVANGHVFGVNQDGIVTCIDAKKGELVYQERLRPRSGTVYASLFASGGKIYCVSREKGTYVLAAKPKFEILAHNVIEDDNSIFNASPVADRGQILLRSDKHVYCIGNKE